jgi:carboxyl-terminal processing protease
MVVSTISGGPSESVGLKPGDRLVFVDGKNVAGIGITNEEVFKKLRGTGGTKVKLKVRRNNVSKLLDFTIVRGKIPIKSIDVAFMVDDQIGYIKVSRFAATTYNEYIEAFGKLKNAGMQKLILDLRDNPGGYLDAATELADEFLPDKKLLVYTQGKSRPRSNHYATSVGAFETGKLFVLINEGSASASEILAGALQDWDRAEIIGRRSFGKGLVQEQTMFPDGSGMRLTVARYYTPTGRCIQKSYTDGLEAYNDDLDNRFKHGELINADSVHFTDTVKYVTPGGKVVYGGGGIMPDVFIPIDTTDDNEFTRAVFGLGLVSQFCYDYVDRHRPELSVYKTAKQFDEHFQPEVKIKSDFIAYAIKDGAKPDEKLINASQKLITTQLKATLARLLFGNDGFYPVLLKNDKTFLRAVEDAKK